MKTLLRAIGTTALIAALAAPAHAQEKSFGMLTVGKGTVMTSKGGEFNPAKSGDVVQVGDRIMLAENSSATVAYPGCTLVNFTLPGVYTIKEPAACRQNQDANSTDAPSIQSVAATNAGFITFAAAIVASGFAASALDDDEDLVNGAQPPMSH
jgi:hypothetical protein